MAADASTPDLSEGRVGAYLRGELPEHERAAVEARLDREPEWLAVVAMLARGEGIGRSPAARPSAGRPETASDDPVLAQLEHDWAGRVRPGARLGRYRVERTVGRGGMGLVLEAHDPQLDRRVALKVLRGGSSRGQTRLVREARTLARLRDRHVITVYDVGTSEGRVFLAMELLTGPTLRAWRSAGPRRWKDVLRVYLQAGWGLVAAHEAGLVHRDFKPDNAMFHGDGRVVVLDFGLARGSADDPSIAGAERSAPESAEAHRDRTGESLGPGRIVGTPAYMAPEQRCGASGPAADQYSYCAALYEALFARLPGRDGAPRYHAAAIGRVPRGVLRALARGLELEPTARHPSMRTLVETLARELQPRTSRWVAMATVAGLGVALGWGPAESTPCSNGTRVLSTTLDPERAAAVVGAVRATARPWSDAAADGVERRLQAFGETWVAEYDAACRATSIANERSEAVLDRRVHCLEQRRRSLAAVLEVIAHDRDALTATQALDALPSVASCRDEVSLARPDDPTVRAEIDELHHALTRADALRRAARYDEASSVIEPALRRAGALHHAPTLARARLAAAALFIDRGEHERAEAELEAALDAAQAAGDDESTAIAWERLAWVVGYKLARHEDGRRLAEHARAWNRRLGGSTVRQMSILRTLGWIEHDAGAPELAIRHFEAALAAAERSPVPDPVVASELAVVLNGLGAAAFSSADLPRARAAFERAAATLREELGPEHPEVARVNNNVASLLRAEGQAEAARELLAGNLEVFTAALGERHPSVGQTMINLAVAELDLGRPTEAERRAARAIEVLTEAHGPEHPLVAKAHTLRGDALVQLHRSHEAIEALQRAAVLEGGTFGEDHPSFGIIESNLGAAYYDLEDFDAAARHQERSLAILRASVGDEHPHVATVLVSLGLTRRAQGRPGEALALFRRAAIHADATARPNALTRIGETLLDRGRARAALVELERARALQDEIRTDPGLVGDTWFAIAKTRWALRDRVGARRAAVEALANFRAAEAPQGQAQAERWIEAHRP